MSFAFSSQFAEHGRVLCVGTARRWLGRGDGPLDSGHSLLALKETLRFEGFVDSITLPSDTWVVTESREGLRTKREPPDGFCTLINGLSCEVSIAIAAKLLGYF